MSRLEDLMLCRRFLGIDPPGLEECNKLYGFVDMCEEILTKDSIVLEAGTGYGASTEVFAHYCKHITTLDIQLQKPWDQYGIILDASKLTKYSNVTFLKIGTFEAVNQFLDNSLDLVYLDNVHMPEWIIKEIKAWLPKVKHGAWIGGHDCLPGLHEAITATLGKPDKIFKDSSWIKKIP